MYINILYENRSLVESKVGKTSGFSPTPAGRVGWQNLVLFVAKCAIIWVNLIVNVVMANIYTDLCGGHEVNVVMGED